MNSKASYVAIPLGDKTTTTTGSTAHEPMKQEIPQAMPVIDAIMVVPEGPKASAFLAPQEIVVKPDGLECTKSDKKIIIRKPWFDRFSYAFVATTAIWILAVLASIFLVGIVIEIIPHMLAGLFMGYHVLCTLKNSTVITITSNDITIEQTPIYLWNPITEYSLEKCRSVQCKREDIQNDDDTGIIITYELHIFNENQDSSIRVLKNWKRMEEVVYIQQQMEQILKNGRIAA